MKTLGETATAFSTAMGYVTGALGDVVDLVEDHAIMQIGLAASAAFAGVGILKKVTGQGKKGSK